MLELEKTPEFRKQYRLMYKRGYDMSLLDDALTKLTNEERLDAKYRDHPLRGKYIGSRECHIKDDWVIVYKKEKGRLRLTAMRTGTHQDVFD